MNDQPPQPAEQRVSILVGDRLCVQCGYNLTGQAVLREPHYNMLIVRCPECGTVASPQEYPLLGRWASRWAALLAGLWLLIVLGMLVATGATIFGFSLGTAEEAAGEYLQYLNEQYEKHRQAMIAAAPNASPSLGYSGSEMQQWSDHQDYATLFQQAGGWRSGVTWDALFIWIPAGIVVFLLGCFWSAAMLGHRWRGHLMLSVLIMAIAAGFAFLYGWLEWQNSRHWYWQEARRMVGPPFLLASLVFNWFVLMGGLLLGRRVVRGLIRLLLPPRLRHSLALLWIADGLTPPTRGR